MKSKDIFAIIADTKVGIKEDIMEGKTPISVPEKYIIPDSNTDITDKKAVICTDTGKQYEEDLASYTSGLSKLKEKYEPFITRCNTPAKLRERTFLDSFGFRYEQKEDVNNIDRIRAGEGTWEEIKIPHYHGPEGKWVSYYRKVFNYHRNGESCYLVFKGVDYFTDVYLNGIHVGSHEGFFASFEIDITDCINDKDNVLIIRVENDITTTGEGNRFGKKIYAATGIGWDGPYDGWHHCPAGGGIFDKVYIEERSSYYVSDAYVIPDIDSSSATVKIMIHSRIIENTKIDINVKAVPFNFMDGCIPKTYQYALDAGFGENDYVFTIPVENARLWTCEDPYLYTLYVTVSGNDEYECNFGMRKFVMDEADQPYGTLYLNNEPVMMRGANEMGHLQLCVLRNDYEQLIEDILIAKYCNMNYYRITQRPVQKEIYDFCDMLGMMVQCDFPLFGQLLRSQMYEAARQAGEMERHIRQHPSVVMITYINEPTNQVKSGNAHRNLVRSELEDWFDICDRFIRYENPARVIKRVEGDYDPPTRDGLSDFHCYNMWYTNHALPIGDLYRGYLPATKKGWKIGCGEYGTEGLDNYEVMRKYYPKEWLPSDDDYYWIPDRIVKAQTNSMHGDWYEEQDNIKDWIKYSQAHQAKATRLMTLALRRRSDYIIQTALHLLTDAWPSGWMKSLVGVDRIPKPAYFEFMHALEPVKLNFRCDRWTCYKGEKINVEYWILNDTPLEYPHMTVKALLTDDNGKVYKEYVTEEQVLKCSSEPFGYISIDTADIEIDNGRKDIYLIGMLETDGRIVNKEIFHLGMFSRNEDKIRTYPIGNIALKIVETCDALKCADIDKAEFMVISSQERYDAYLKDLKTEDAAHIAKLRKMFILSEKECSTYCINGKKMGMSDKRMWKATYSPINRGLLKGYKWDDLSFLYDGNTDKINFSAEYFVDSEQKAEAYVFAYRKPSFYETVAGRKEKLPVMTTLDEGIFTTLCMDGRTGYNPILDKIINDAARGIV
jgi:hypothetical protein